MISASPIAVRKIEFLRVFVEANDRADPNTIGEFSFNGATIGWAFHSGQNEDGSTWVGVGFATGNEADKGPICPYMLDIQAIGVFTIADSVEEGKREQLVFECGAALVYGAIREMVANITSRSAFGRLMLPTPTFQGLYEQQKAPDQD
jgi:hypothetical protein